MREDSLRVPAESREKRALSGSSDSNFVLLANEVFSSGTNTFLDSSVTISPHKSLNTSRGVISEPDLLSTPESEVLEGFSDQDENITKVKCPPLNLLQPLPKPDVSISTPVISTSSSTQAHLLPATSSTATAVSDPQPPTPTPNNTLSTTNNMFTSLKPQPTSVIKTLLTQQ
ncbi:hypothetical protein TNCV_1728201 [Trichonephila clavipes]|nr:hypothetical protein TNCV_1728201 [Trichonephila clavipes]